MTVSESSAGSAWGAAIMGLESLKIEHDIKIKQFKTWTPDSQYVARYHDLSKIWQDVSRKLEPEYQKISDFQQKYNK